MVQADSESVRKKVNLVLTIRSTYLSTIQPKQVSVQWSRSNKQSSTKSLPIGGENESIAKFNAKFACDAGLKYVEQSDTWLADINELTLICDDEKVGTCSFDIAPFIDQGTQSFKAEIQPEHYEVQTYNEVVLKGDCAAYPGAYLEFRVKVESKRRAPASTRSAVSAISGKSGSRVKP